MSLNFANITAISIPEGSVTKIEDAGGRILWQSGISPATSLVYYDKLIFDGTAYIETTYVLPENCSIGVTLGNETVKASQGVFYSSGGGGYTSFAIGGNTDTTRRQMVPYYDSSSYLASNRYLKFSNALYSYFMTPSRFGWGSTSYTYTKGNLHPTGGLVLGALASKSTFYSGCMYAFRIYDSSASSATTYGALTANTAVATFRPCTYNGEAGMWYVEGNTFFGNSAGSGSLSVSN